MSQYPSAGGYPGYPPQQQPPGTGGYPPPQPPGGASAYGAPTGGASAYPQQPGAYPGQTGQQPGAYPGQNAQQPGAYPGQTAQQPGAYPGQTGQQPGAYGASAYPGQANPQAYPPQQTGYPPTTQSGFNPSAPPYSTSHPSTSYPGQQPGGYQPYSGYPPASGYPATGYPPQGGAPGAPSLATAQQGGAQAWVSNNHYGQLYNQIIPTDMQALQAWFASVDRDRSGEISAAELAQLNFNNRLLGQDPARRLIAVFDKDRSGQINFNEYASMHQFLNNLLKEFQQAERQTPGFIGVNNLAYALSALGFNLSPGAVTNIAKRFDAQKRGQLTWDEFLALASHVGLLKSVFDWAHPGIDGKITFDFESFAFATLYL